MKDHDDVTAWYAERIERARRDAQELVELAVELVVEDRVVDEAELYVMIFDRLSVCEEHGVEVPLPAGLRRCVRCGGIEGTSVRTRIRSSCWCDGIPCRRCCIGRVRSPMTEYYDLRERTFVHVSAVAGRGTCAPCRRLLERRLPGYLISSDWVSDNPLGDELARIRAVGLTLRHSIPLDAARGADVIALHGDDAAWRRLVGYGLPRDEPPLHVGASVDEAVTLVAGRLGVGPAEAERWIRRSLTVGCCGVDPFHRDATISALRARWRPPLDEDA